MATLFISDLHLQPQRPHITRAFLHFLAEQATGSDALYILGDLFDLWIGDDENTPLQQQIAQALNKLSGRGTAVYFVPGNRDFLLGRDYAKRAGLIRLSDPTCIDLYGTPTLLLHGDSLCTDDKSYQRYRSVIRSRFIQKLQTHLSIANRQRIGRMIRGRSSEVNQYKSRELMDINRLSAQQLLDRHQAKLMIHGHTHRPATHDDPPRIVLGDWDKQGWYLISRPDGSHHLTQFNIDEETDPDQLAIATP